MGDDDGSRAAEQTIANSGLFDAGWYEASYAEFLTPGQDPIDHYVSRGWLVGFDPNPAFDTRYYLRTNPECTGSDPLSHYIRHGAWNGRRPSPGFDPAYYIANNLDVAQSGMEPLAHYLAAGRAEGRAGCDPEAERSAGGDPVSASPADAYFAYRDQPSARIVPFSKHRFLPSPPVRTIAFYLPQFHAIPENDRWWGTGFTEWTNTTRARPQFHGHYQPHLPGEFGFYDLRHPEAQRRQAELAAAYGISAFCFYFYWFGSKRLLEHPIRQFATDPDIALPFCLCWANENWTRRWDGLDQEILIGQKHSAEDDLAFIAYVAEYLNNPRYLRIDGKPLLLVYRPHLLPDMKATVDRWRTWFRDAGHGELYIASTKSFSADDPVSLGLDAAIEFPPINAPPWQGVQPKLLNPEFRGRFLDWTHFVAESRDYPPAKDDLFRTVCPSWDNEARRPGRGTVLMGSSAEGYLEWVENAAMDAVARFASPDERLIFVNAWNEWAEGAHLEPDRRHGYAYLESHRVALVRAALRLAASERMAAGRASGTRLAAAVHAFYPDIFAHLLKTLRGNPQIEKFYITSTRENLAELDRICLDHRLEYELIEVENRGRDMLPFLTAMARIRNEGFDCVLKLHTKRSLHRSDGDDWRDEIYETLGHPDQTAWIMAALADDPTIGIVGPAGHLLSQEAFIGSNEATLRWIMGRLGIAPDRPFEADVFVGGSMFYARCAALEPLLALALRDEDFEAEAGQVDATLAHALERAMAYSAAAAGLGVVAAPKAGLGSDRRLRTEFAGSYRFARSALEPAVG